MVPRKNACKPSFSSFPTMFHHLSYISFVICEFLQFGPVKSKTERQSKFDENSEKFSKQIEIAVGKGEIA